VWHGVAKCCCVGALALTEPLGMSQAGALAQEILEHVDRVCADPRKTGPLSVASTVHESLPFEDWPPLALQLWEYNLLTKLPTSRPITAADLDRLGPTFKVGATLLFLGAVHGHGFLLLNCALRRMGAARCGAVRCGVLTEVHAGVQPCSGGCRGRVRVAASGHGEPAALVGVGCRCAVPYAGRGGPCDDGESDA
jgi:hypothetical protein